MTKSTADQLADAVRVIRQLEWSVRSDMDYARVGLEFPAPYTGYHCMACKGVSAQGGSIRGQGHKFWCPVADLLVELGEEVEREEPTRVYQAVLDLCRDERHGFSQSPNKATYITEAFGAYGIESRELEAKLYRDLGLEVPDELKPSPRLPAS